MKLTEKLRFAWITNNAYDTLAILQGDTVVSSWTVTRLIAIERLDNPDPSDWDLNHPDETAISDYGEEVTGEALLDRLAYYTR